MLAGAARYSVAAMGSVSPSIRNLAWFAAACFLAGWLLPAASEVPGWMAFRYALSPLWPYKGSTADGFEDAVPQVLSALTNIVFIVMFVLLIANKVARPSLYFRVAIACCLLDLYWFVQLLRDGTVSDLRVGYYVWLAAFAIQVLIGWMLTRAKQ